MNRLNHRTMKMPSPDYDLPDAIAKLHDDHSVDVAYRAFYALCLSNKVPGAYRGTNGRWRIKVDALADIAGILRARAAE